MQIKVIKPDNSVEEYSHKKVVDTINGALAKSGEGDMSVAEKLAQIVTDYLHNEQKSDLVPSGAIYEIINTVLTKCGYAKATYWMEITHEPYILKERPWKSSKEMSREIKRTWWRMKRSRGLIEKESLTVLIDPGDATAEDLSELFVELSTLYRMIGGSGIDFRITETREPASVYVC